LVLNVGFIITQVRLLVPKRKEFPVCEEYQGHQEAEEAEGKLARDDRFGMDQFGCCLWALEFWGFLDYLY
jgi:hypothetical protein